MRFLDVVKRGFKPDKKVLITFIYDILFYVFLVIGFLMFAFLLKNVLTGIQGVNLSSFLSDDVSAINLNAKLLETVFAKMMGTIFIFLVYILAIFTLFKGLIWTKLLDKTFSLRYMWKSFIINLIYFVIFFSLFVYFVVSVKNNILALASVLIFLHFSALTYYFFTKENKIFFSIKKSIKFTFTKAGYLINYLIISAGLVISMFIIRLILRLFPESASMIILSIVIVLVFALFRNYFVKFMENDKN